MCVCACVCSALAGGDYQSHGCANVEHVQQGDQTQRALDAARMMTGSSGSSSFISMAVINPFVGGPRTFAPSPPHAMSIQYYLDYPLCVLRIHHSKTKIKLFLTAAADDDGDGDAGA